MQGSALVNPPLTLHDIAALDSTNRGEQVPQIGKPAEPLGASIALKAGRLAVHSVL